MRHVVQGAKTWGAALLAVLAVAPGARAGGADLPVALSREGDHEGAALEFRRLAMDTGESAGRGAFYWAAAHEYWQAGRYELADRMLDNAENARRDLEAPVLLLRGQNALSDGAWSEAAFYLQDAVSRTADDDFRELAARRLAVARLRQKDLGGARDALQASPETLPQGLEALDRYAAGRDKNPKLGGFLGLVPGFGYFYAGEYASGVRSIILNGLFIFGMVASADHDQWGAFTVITFFEFTWYSGSIYGGIDASHRYNRRRLERCAADIRGYSEFSPDYDQLPAVALKFRF